MRQIITESLKRREIFYCERNRLKKDFYAAKSIMKLLSLGYQKINIHTILCMLYYIEYANLTECRTCGNTWYKPRTDMEKTDILPNHFRLSKLLMF